MRWWLRVDTNEALQIRKEKNGKETNGMERIECNGMERKGEWKVITELYE